LRDAGHYVAALPKATQSLPVWQVAAEMLLNAAERGGITMMAEMAVRRALHGQPTMPEPRRRTT
jgi:DNA-binding transcriptional LysR family regulator